MQMLDERAGIAQPHDRLVSVIDPAIVSPRHAGPSARWRVMVAVAAILALGLTGWAIVTKKDHHEPASNPASPTTRVTEAEDASPTTPVASASPTSTEPATTAAETEVPTATPTTTVTLAPAASSPASTNTAASIPVSSTAETIDNPDIPVTGRFQTPDDQLAIAMADTEVDRECMAAKGWRYPATTAQDWAEFGGAWQPDAVLGVRGLVAASTFGYHGTNIDDATQPAQILFRTLSSQEKKRFGTDSNACFGELTAAFGGDLYVRQQSARAFVIGIVGEDFKRMTPATDEVASAEGGPAVTAALASWRSCLQSAVGETAATPSEMEGRYRFAVSVTTHEKLVARADVVCQQQTSLWLIDRTAVAAKERELMGDNVDTYDELSRLNQQMAAKARQILADRGILVPSL